MTFTDKKKLTRYTSMKCPAKDKKKRSHQKFCARRKCERTCAMDRKESQPGTSATSMYTGILQLRFNVSK